MYYFGQRFNGGICDIPGNCQFSIDYKYILCDGNAGLDVFIPEPEIEWMSPTCEAQADLECLYDYAEAVLIPKLIEKVESDFGTVGKSSYAMKAACSVPCTTFNKFTQTGVSKLVSCGDGCCITTTIYGTSGSDDEVTSSQYGRCSKSPEFEKGCSLHEGWESCRVRCYAD